MSTASGHIDKKQPNKQPWINTLTFFKLTVKVVMVSQVEVV